MIALYIILAILLLIFLILLVKVEFYADYSDKLKLTLKILFFKKTIVDPNEKKKPKKKEEKPKKEEKKKDDKKKKEEKKEKKSYLTKLKEKKGLPGIVSIFTSLAKIAQGLLKNVFKHIVVHRFDVNIVIVGEDAADTAIKYGELCAVIYSSVDILLSITDTKDYSISVMPDFDSDAKPKISVVSNVHIRPLFVLHHAIIAGIKLLIARAKL